MIELEDLPEFTKVLIAARPYFAGETIINNDGKQLNNFEKAFNERGFVIVVHPPNSGQVSPGNGVGRTTPIMVTAHIEIALNPEKNAKVAQKGLIASMKAALDALRNYNPTNQNDRYEVPENAFDLVTDDEGSYCCILRYRKKAIL
jgi:hypothetical protein